MDMENRSTDFVAEVDEDTVSMALVTSVALL